MELYEGLFFRAGMKRDALREEHVPRMFFG